MKRFHVHAAVADLKQAVAFYSSLFGATPNVMKPDYAKWLLEDPRLNFAITEREGVAPGLRHLGIQAESTIELEEIAKRLGAAGNALREEKTAACCYAVSDKTWVTDPAGLLWENFHTFGVSAELGSSVAEQPCCPKPAVEQTQGGHADIEERVAAA